MVIFKSPHVDVEVPEHITTWEWAFESEKYSPLCKVPKEQPGAFIDAITKEKLDFAQLKTKATQLCTALTRNHGFRVGDVVTIFSVNTVWYPVALWAVNRGGGRVNGASPAYNAEEMSYALRTAKARFLMTLPKTLDVALAAAKKAGIPRENVFLLEGQADGITSIQSLIGIGAEFAPSPSFKIPKGKSNRDICGFLTFSSGTTGLPKAVMISHHNIIAQCHQLKQLQLGPYRMLAIMPLFHIMGLTRFCIHPVFMNGDVFMLPSFTMESMLQAICEFRLKEIHLVPPIIIRLVHDKIVDKYDLRHVERWSSGSAPISPQIIALMEKKFPGTGFRQGYGATESTGCLSATAPGYWDYKYAMTGGMLVANTEVKVVDLSTGKELGPNQSGELYARGPQIAMGYLDNPTETAETFDEWFHTGDVGYINDLGLVHIEDRIKEMMKVKGSQVAPAELEDLLLGHPLVEDCAVLGIPDMYAGERPKAYVVLKKGKGMSRHRQEDVGQQLLQFVKDNKVRNKWIVEIEFADMTPKSPTGKLLRRVLKVQESKKGRIAGVRVRDEARTAHL